MREIYTSPRPENIERVVALLAEHGIEARVTNRAVYDHPGFRRVRYGPGESRQSWARVEVKYAKDLAAARALLRKIGIAPLTRFAEELEASRRPRGQGTPQAVARRVRTIMLVLLAAALIVLFVLMSGIT